MTKLLSFVCLMLLAFNSPAIEQHVNISKRVYVAPLEKSHWELTKNSIFSCEIEHRIPYFGKAIFYQENGRTLKFRLQTRNFYKKDLDASLSSTTANWKKSQRSIEMARLKTSGTSQLVMVEKSVAKEAYYELQQGYNLSLDFIDSDDGYNSVSIVVSTVNFRDVEQQFSECISNLYHYNFDDVKKALVHFDFDAEFPKVEEEERKLKNMLAYLKVDPNVSLVTVIGHTDYKGRLCYNDTLSQRRALYIYDYLLQSGVDPKKLFLEFRGETEPAINKKDDASRAINRRVEVLMSK